MLNSVTAGLNGKWNWFKLFVESCTKIYLKGFAGWKIVDRKLLISRSWVVIITSMERYEAVGLSGKWDHFMGCSENRFVLQPPLYGSCCSILSEKLSFQSKYMTFEWFYAHFLGVHDETDLRWIVLTNLDFWSDSADVKSWICSYFHNFWKKSVCLLLRRFDLVWCHPFKEVMCNVNMESWFSFVLSLLRKLFLKNTLKK
jgi:hypothetical protein